MSGSPQATFVNTGFVQHLRVRVADDQGNPRPQIPVLFVPPLSGPGAVLSSASALSDANGFAEVTATANGQAGSYPVNALVLESTLETPIFVAFDLTNASTSISEVPALSGWGIAVLALALAAAAVVALRRGA